MHFLLLPSLFVALLRRTLVPVIRFFCFSFLFFLSVHATLPSSSSLRVDRCLRVVALFLFCFSFFHSKKTHEKYGTISLLLLILAPFRLGCSESRHVSLSFVFVTLPSFSLFFLPHILVSFLRTCRFANPSFFPVPSPSFLCTPASLTSLCSQASGTSSSQYNSAYPLLLCTRSYLSQVHFPSSPFAVCTRWFIRPSLSLPSLLLSPPFSLSVFSCSHGCACQLCRH